MTARERIIKMFGSIEKVPAYLKRALGIREDAQRKREEEQKQYKERKKREQEEKKSLRRPPANVWRVGSTIFWDPPETVDQLKPAGYWISESRNGSWTNHGDYLLPDYRSAQLFGNGDARVEAYYHDTALGEVYVSPTVSASEDEDPYLVDKVQYYISVKGRVDAYYDRWRRALAGFGVAKGKMVRGTMVEPLFPAMTAEEAQTYADRGWNRWVPVAKALHRIEKIRNK